MRLIYSLVILLALTLAPVRGQNSSGDVVSLWQGQVEQFALAISNSTTVDECISPDATFRRYGETVNGSISSLVRRLADTRVISARGGTNPMISLASDLAADAMAAELDVRLLKLIDVSEESRRSADSVAARWLAAELGAKVDDPIALIVLLESRQTGPQLHFILAKGRHDSDGKFVIIHAVHATLDQLLR